VFGFSMGEIVLLLIVGIIVVGPKKLPTMMRTAGQWVTRLRRMSTDLRSQSGIDDLIRQEGLEKEIQQLRSLSRVNVIDTFITPALTAPVAAAAVAPSAPASSAARARPSSAEPLPLREREYPALGCDAYGAMSEDAALYHAPPKLEVAPAEATVARKPPEPEPKPADAEPAA
jgi:sec-independent protein translocase protein TatB